MNKTIKIISILLVAVMTIMTLSNVCFASDAGGAINAFVDGTTYSSTEIDGVKAIAQRVLTAIRNISIIVAIIMISVLGIQYMVGSAEQKASYKKAFIPMIVGVLLVVSAAQIATMLFNIGNAQ